MFNTPNHNSGAVGSNGLCERKEGMELIGQVSPTYIWQQGEIQETSYSNGELVSHLKGSKWNPPYPTQSAIEDRYIQSVSLQKYLDPNDPDHYGNPLMFNVNLSDGYLYNKSFVLTIPAIWPVGHPLYAGPFAYDLNSYTVTGNEIWTPSSNPVSATTGSTTITIEKELIVPAGTTLRMEGMRIEFGPEGRMRIKSHSGSVDETPQKAARVEVINSTLTSLKGCDDANGMWNGIRIEGYTSKSQEEFPNAPGWQGTLVMENSELSDARDALDCWGRDNDWNFDFTGGRVFAKNSRFINNSRTAQIIKYKNCNPANPAQERPYRTSFTNCDFIVNRALSKEFRGFISGWEVNGFQIRGCRFDNQSGIETPSNYGIYGTCGVTIDGLFTGQNIKYHQPPSTPTEFRNLKDAVHVEQFGYTKAYAVVANSNFYNCGVGVQSDAGLGAMVVRNSTFDLAKRWVNGFSSSNYNTGALMQATTGFLINNNTFYNTFFSRAKTAGVHIWNSGSTDNVVNRNIYDYLYTGNLGNYINKGLSASQKPVGLKFLCNENKTTLFDIAARGNDSVTNGIHPQQINASEKAAGNVFAYDRNWELAIYPGEVAPITYYYDPDPNAINQKPITYPATTVTITEVRPSGCAVPGPVYSYLEEYGGDAGAGEVIVKLPVTPVPLPRPGDPVNGEDRSEAIAWFMTDSAGMGSRDSLYLWLQLPGNDAYHDLMRTDMLLEDEKVTEAVALYGNIVSTHKLQGEEEKEFSSWGKKLLDIRLRLQQSGRNKWQVEPSEISILKEVAENAAMWAKVRAQSWLTMLNPDLTFENQMLYPECTTDCDDSTGGLSRTAAPIAGPAPAIAQVQQQPLSLSPNPTTGLLKIVIGSEATLRIQDLTGRLVHEAALQAGVQEINLSALPAGVYLYRIREVKGATFTGKIIKE